MVVLRLREGVKREPLEGCELLTRAPSPNILPFPKERVTSRTTLVSSRLAASTSKTVELDNANDLDPDNERSSEHGKQIER